MKIAERGEGAVVNTKRKGTRAERRAIRILEAFGSVCTKAGGSLGLFDVIAIGPANVRLIQVKAGTTYLSAVERARISALVVPATMRREGGGSRDRCRVPFVERLSAEVCAG
jgi:Holliday junction resolvase